MSLADDFLSHARFLVSLPRPLESVICRRVVAASYYALFHQIVQDAASLFGPNVDSGVSDRIQRWFEHAAMKQICGRFVKPKLEQPLSGLIGDVPSQALKNVCSTFISLQEARHDADYNPAYFIDEDEALRHWVSAAVAVSEWQSIRNTSEANVFILSLLLFKNWDRER